MAFVLDASVGVSWCFEDERTAHTQAVLDILEQSYALVPALWHFEVSNVLLMNERKDRITPSQAQRFLHLLRTLDIRTDFVTASLLDDACLALARTHQLTAYDASYLELAVRAGLPLATVDKDLIRAAQSAGVTLA
jgi:predicted nucleic acid-binding protein